MNPILYTILEIIILPLLVAKDIYTHLRGRNAAPWDPYDTIVLYLAVVILLAEIVLLYTTYVILNQYV